MKIDRMEMYVSEMRHRYFYMGTIHPLNGNGVMFHGASKSSIVFQNKREPNLRGRLGWESFATLQAETKRVPGENSIASRTETSPGGEGQCEDTVS